LGHLQREHDANVAQADFGDQPFEAGSRHAAATDAQVVVDDDNLPWPTGQRYRASRLPYFATAPRADIQLSERLCLATSSLLAQP